MGEMITLRGITREAETRSLQARGDTTLALDVIELVLATAPSPEGRQRALAALQTLRSALRR